MNLQCNNINVSYDGKKVLKNIEFEVRKGELVSLLGPSGCGKSTLLKTIAGLISPDNGEIYIDGKSVKQIPPNKRGTVIVFQDLRLFPNMNIEDNVAFPMKMQGLEKALRNKRAAELLDMVQLTDFGKRKITQMSGGQLQRAALARALAASPQILLLDEPFSSLDEGLRQEMRNLVLSLHRQSGITTILVTHDPKEALMISDRIAVMLSGRIAQYDDTRTLYNYPANKAIADYFGDANYLEGKVSNSIFISNAVSFTADRQDGTYTAMFRPTAIKLRTGSGEYEIQQIDYMGEHSNITLQSCDIKLLLSVVTNEALQIGDKVGVEFDTTKAILLEGL